jgi:hypothetical protein
MRSVAPESAGAAASQNNWLVEYLKPSDGSPTATTLQTCQIAKARNSAGTLIHRLSLAIASPSRDQKALSSGVQTVRTRPCFGATATWVVMVFSLMRRRSGVRCERRGRRV